MKYIVSRFNHNIAWLNDYTNDIVLYDRSDNAMYSNGFSIFKAKNIGSDIYDKFTFIIDHYDNLPEVACYIKANLFDYIRPKEFELIKNNKTFTPILTQFHKEVMCDEGMLKALGKSAPYPFSYYKDGMYYELNYSSYLKSNPAKNQPTPITLEWYKNLEIVKLLGIDKMEYLPFAPGSNYILPRENILKHSKEFYEKLRSFIDWGVYPGEVFILERGLYNLWR